MNIYRPPFDPYSERQEANDPNPALRSPWDGCWAWTLARAINGTTGGKVTCIVPGKTVERVIRDAAGVPDRSGIADGGTLNQQVTALSKLVPAGTWYSSRPTQAEFRAHLAAGGIAVMAGWEDQAPISDRAYDVGFYDRHGSNGHSNFGQGVGDGKGVVWGNPEKPNGVPEPIVSIDAALKFVWDSQAGGYPRVECLLLKSVEIALPIPTPTPPTQPEDAVSTPLGTPTGIARVNNDVHVRGITTTGQPTVLLTPGADYPVYGEVVIPGYADPPNSSPTSEAWRIAVDGETRLLKRNATFTPIGADPAPLAALQAKIAAAKAALG